MDQNPKTRIEELRQRIHALQIQAPRIGSSEWSQKIRTLERLRFQLKELLKNHGPDSTP